MKGVILWFDPPYGIARTDTGELVFVHSARLAFLEKRPLAEGLWIEFSIKTFRAIDGRDYRYANSIRILDSSRLNLLSASVQSSSMPPGTDFDEDAAERLDLGYRPGHLLEQGKGIATACGWLTDRFVDHLYAGIELKGKSHTVLICAYISAGGRGDLVLALKVGAVLKARIPGLRVGIITLPDGYGAQKLLHWSTLRELVGAHDELEILVPGKLEGPFRKPDLVLGVPGVQCYEELGETLKGSPKPAFVRIAEAGFSHSFAKEQQPDTLCRANSIGFRSYELGVFTEKVPIRDVGKLSDAAAELRRVLLEDGPHAAPERHLYFGYGHQAAAIGGFVHLVLAAEAHRQAITGPCRIDICIPAGHVDATFFAAESLAARWVRALKLSTITFIDEQMHTVKILQFVDGSCALRIIESPRLEHDDFLTMLTASEPLSLCTGDQSLMESLSAGKVICYEIAEHKRAFAGDLLCLARILDEAAGQYLERVKSTLSAEFARKSVDAQQQDCDAIAEMLIDDSGDWSLLRAFANLAESIETHYQVDERLAAKVKRLLLRRYLAKSRRRYLLQALIETEQTIAMLIQSPASVEAAAKSLETRLARLFELIHLSPCTINLGPVECVNCGHAPFASLIPK